MSHLPHYSATCTCRNCNAVRADAYPAEYRTRDAKSIKRFVESVATYKSSRWNRLKGEGYDAGGRLARHYGVERPTNVEALASLAAMMGVRVDTTKRTRHFAAIAARPENVAARNAAYEALRAREQASTEPLAMYAKLDALGRR